MTKTRRASLIVCLGLGSLCISLLKLAVPVPAQEPGALTLKVRATRSAYELNAPIEMEFTLLNSGKEPLIVPRHLKLRMNIKLQIADPERVRANWCGRIADELAVLKGNYRTLASGESLQSRLVISCENAQDPSRAWGYGISKPGRYVVEASYQLSAPKEDYKQLFPNSKIIVGPISAEPVAIIVR